MIDRETFFDRIRPTFSGGRLSAEQVAGMEGTLAAWEADFPTADPRWLAYPLATDFHETGQKMTSTTENLNYTSAARIRKVWPSRFPTEASAQPFVRNPEGLANKVYGGRMGNKDPGDGWKFRGRCHVQLTGRENYERATRKLQEMGHNVNLVADPDRALEATFASLIMLVGMMEGWFTGKKMLDYFNAKRDDPIEARRIINADVKENGSKIAAYHRAFLAAIKASTVDAAVA